MKFNEVSVFQIELTCAELELVEGLLVKCNDDNTTEEESRFVHNLLDYIIEVVNR